MESDIKAIENKIFLLTMDTLFSLFYCQPLVDRVNEIFQKRQHSKITAKTEINQLLFTAAFIFVKSLPNDYQNRKLTNYLHDKATKLAFGDLEL